MRFVLLPSCLRGLILLVVAAMVGCGAPGAEADRGARGDVEQAELNANAETARVTTRPARTFRFHYAVTIDQLPPGKTARVWLPVARDSYEQTARIERVALPAEHRRTREQRFGNDVIYFEAVADASGEIDLEVEYLVERRELAMNRPEPKEADHVDQYLLGSQLVPVDGSLSARLLGGKDLPGDPLAAGRMAYQAVAGRMRYDKPPGEPWGRGDAVWACDAGFGNCTDFHSLFIGAVQDMKIPARFEIGFPLPPELGEGSIDGYHCWAKFLDGDRWIPVDISEADKHPELREYYFGNLTADRVMFSTGRDLQLDPAPKSGPVNFLVYPYVEVEGRPHTSLVKRFRYQDVAP